MVGLVRHISDDICNISLQPDCVVCLPQCQLRERPPVRPSSSLTTINITIFLTSSLKVSLKKRNILHCTMLVVVTLLTSLAVLTVLTVLTVWLSVVCSIPWLGKGEETEQLVSSPPAHTRHWALARHCSVSPHTRPHQRPLYSQNQHRYFIPARQAAAWGVKLTSEQTTISVQSVWTQSGNSNISWAVRRTIIK